MKRLILFALIFIVLGGLYWLLESSGDKNADREKNYFLENFQSADVNRINISNPDTDTIVLQRVGEQWLVETDGTTYRADSPAVQALIESLAELKTNSMVSRKPDRHALFEVTAETGVQVETLGHEGTLAKVLIGKSGPNIFSTYVRIVGNDEVYLIDGILKNTISKTLNEWRNKTIFTFDPELVTTYMLTGNPSLALSKTDGTWWLGPQNIPANMAAVEQAMRALSTLNAVDFAEGSLEEFELISPAQSITVGFADGTQATLLLGSDANAFQQYAKTDNADTIYIVEKHILRMLSPTMEALTAEEPEEQSPAE